MIAIQDFLSSPDLFLSLPSNDADILHELAKDYFNAPSEHKEKNKYLILSAIVNLTHNNPFYLNLIESCAKDDTMTKENRYYAYRQLIRYKFLHQEANTPEANDLLDDLFDRVLNEYETYLMPLCKRIPQKERSNDFVIVLTTQMLGMTHAPTKILMDRCYVLQKTLNKKIFIINTADVLSTYGQIPWYNSSIGGYIEELSSVDSIKYKDTTFSYFQCPREMPNADIIGEILKLVSDEKPEYIIAIGENSITACLCSHIVPVLTLTLTSTARIGVRTTFQATGKITNEDMTWLQKHNFPSEHFIKGVNTYAIPMQKNKYSRKDLNLPETDFICITVGYRLDAEVDDDFLEMIQKLAANDIYTVLIGDFNRFNDVCEKYSILKKYLIPLGFQKDLLAVYECCDVYINPRRIGGGTSAIEALSKSLPVLTLNYGDVSGVVGNDFCYDSYNDMYDEILKLAGNTSYLKSRKEKALERANQLTDSAKEFPELLQAMKENALFW